MVLGANEPLAAKFIASAPTGHKFVRIARNGSPDGDATSIESCEQIPQSAFASVDCIVNCAGAMKGTSRELDNANHLLPLQAARQGLAHGVRRFVQVSSFSIFGRAEMINSRIPFSPDTAYGASKMAAEQALNGLRDQGLEPVLVRVPIIYDHATGTKLLLLARLMSRLGWFFEPRSVPRRAMIHVENCAALLHYAIAQRLSGTLFGADEEMFEIGLLAEALRKTGRRISVTRVPDAMLSPLNLLSPGIYASLFRPSILCADDNACFAFTASKTLRQGLAEIAETL